MEETRILCYNHPNKFAKKNCSLCIQNICNSCAIDLHYDHLDSISKLSDHYFKSKDIISNLSNEISKLTISSSKKFFNQCMTNRFHEAKNYCRECGGFLCEKCKTSHDPSHNIIDNHLFSKCITEKFQNFFSFYDQAFRDNDEIIKSIDIVQQIYDSSDSNWRTIIEKCDDYRENNRRCFEQIVAILRNISKRQKEHIKEKMNKACSAQWVQGLKKIYEEVRRERDQQKLFILFANAEKIVNSIYNENDYLNLKNYVSSYNSFYDYLINHNRPESLDHSLFEKTYFSVSSYQNQVIDKIWETFPIEEGKKNDYLTFEYNIPEELTKLLKDQSYNALPITSHHQIEKVPEALHICQQEFNIPGLLKPDIEYSKSFNNELRFCIIGTESTQKLSLLQSLCNEIEFSINSQSKITNNYLSSIDNRSLNTNKEITVTQTKETRSDTPKLVKKVSLKTSTDRVVNFVDDYIDCVVVGQNNEEIVNCEKTTQQIEERRDDLIKEEGLVSNDSEVSKEEILKAINDVNLESKDKLLQKLDQKTQDQLQIYAVGYNCKSIFIFNLLSKKIVEEEFDHKFPTFHSFANYQGNIYLTGGKDDNKVLNSFSTIKRLSYNNYHKEDLPPMSSPRFNHNSFILNEQLFVISGSRNRSVENYHLKHQKWSQLPDLNHSRERCCGFIYNEQLLYVFLGYDRETNKYPCNIEILDLKAPYGWKVIEPLGTPNLMKRYSFTLLQSASSNKIYFCGGYNHTKNESKDCTEYDFVSNKLVPAKFTLPTTSTFVLNSFTIDTTENFAMSLNENFSAFVFVKAEERIILIKDK